MLPYQFAEHVVRISAHDYCVRTLLDHQQFSDDSHLAADLGINDATWALFGVIWPASRVLATHVSTMPLKGLKVLEIGCGIGLSSIVLHRLGVDVTASDYHPLAQEFLQHNVLHNNLPPIKYLTGNWEARNPLLGEFDLVIGSDVLYQPAHAMQVSAFIAQHGGLGGSALIVDPDRGNNRQFTRHMQQLGYNHHYDRFNVTEKGFDPCRGRILHYQR